MKKSQNLLVRNHEFRLVWIGQVLSQGASKAYLINLLWWIIAQAEITGQSPEVASGALLILTALPPILLVKVIGNTLARFPSKSVLITGEVCGGLLIAGVFFLLKADSLTLPTVYALSSLVAICQGVVDPALTKSVDELVNPEDVEGAVAFEASTQSLAFFMGTAAGATLTGLFGLKAAVLLNVASYAVSALVTARAHFRATELAAEKAPESPQPPVLGALEGVQRLLYAFAAANFLLFPLFLVLPIFTKNTLHSSVVVLGAMEACFWLGLVSGAAASKSFTDQASLPQLVGKLLAVFGVSLLTLAVFPNAWWTGCVLFIGGSTAGIVNVKVISCFQRAVPAPLKGHFFARLQAYVTAAQPIGYLVFTFALVKLQPPFVFGIEGLGLIAVGLATFLNPVPAAR